MHNTWWIVRFKGKVHVIQLDTIPPIPHIGPYWSKSEALKRLWQWGYGFSRSTGLSTRRGVIEYAKSSTH